MHFIQRPTALLEKFYVVKIKGSELYAISEAPFNNHPSQTIYFAS